MVFSGLFLEDFGINNLILIHVNYWNFQKSEIFKKISYAVHMVSLENFVKSMLPSLSELKVKPSFCFAFKIPDDPTATNKYRRHENLYFFRDPDFIVYFEHLETLILDHNRINENVVFPRITTLTTLWMNFNLIGNLFPFADNLAQSFPKLNYLSMMGNPAAPSFINYGKFHDYVVYR